MFGLSMMNPVVMQFYEVAQLNGAVGFAKKLFQINEPIRLAYEGGHLQTIFLMNDADFYNLPMGTPMEWQNYVSVASSRDGPSVRMMNGQMVRLDAQSVANLGIVHYFVMGRTHVYVIRNPIQAEKPLPSLSF